MRANPGKYTFSSSGTGATAHLFAELFNSMAQLKAVQAADLKERYGSIIRNAGIKIEN